MNNNVYLTEEGLKKLEDEISHLINVERPKISKMIAEARDKGDLSENAEYDAAKEAQGMIENKISNLQKTLNNARVIDSRDIDCSEVRIFTTVKIKNLKNNSIVKYTLVSESEADLKAGKISVTSPIGKGILGKKIGDITDITVPSGKIQFEIINIEI